MNKKQKSKKKIKKIVCNNPYCVTNKPNSPMYCPKCLWRD